MVHLRLVAGPGLDGYEERLVELPRYPNIRAGRNKIALSRANMASMVMATARNGSDKSHRKGHRTMARTASGHHNTNRRHQPTITSNAFTGVSPRSLCVTLAHTTGSLGYDQVCLPLSRAADSIRLAQEAAIRLLSPKSSAQPGSN